MRKAALECLVDFVSVEGTFADLLFLLDLIENDPVNLKKIIFGNSLRLIVLFEVPYVRHYASSLMVSSPPFPRARHHRNDREELANRLWKLMK